MTFTRLFAPCHRRKSSYRLIGNVSGYRRRFRLLQADLRCGLVSICSPSPSPASCRPSAYSSYVHRGPRTHHQVHVGKFIVVPLPNVTNVFYGRDVGYAVERIALDKATDAISATQVRRLIQAQG
jgi:hypothetical protein